ncbi:MAG: aminomethyl-transferring glycine dehydrogenase subunit GcvPB [Thermodesulfobacteriota bacterium]
MAECQGKRGLVMDEPLIFERGREGRKNNFFPPSDIPRVRPQDVIPTDYLRDEIEGFPEVSELEVVRHFTRLSSWNYGVDTGFYPLGSCTMKYNPRVNEDIAGFSGFSKSHPYQPSDLSRGALQLMYELEGCLSEISGMDAVTLQPAAGAQGELTGMLMVRAYHRDRGEERDRVLIPDTAHGTNPASSALCGYKVVGIKSGKDGIIHPEVVEEAMDEGVAAIMLTNPNTLGLFEKHIMEIAEIVHSKGGLVFCDGANLNALMGIVRLGNLGVDVMQFNLHKTFSSPHGGGGPGSGPVGVKMLLEPYLPNPRIIHKDGGYELDHRRSESIGRLKPFYGNFGVMVRAYAYIKRLGGEGLKRVSELAVLNANYIKERLKPHYHLPYDIPCMHESVFSDKFQQEHGVKTIDMAKRLIDCGYHPPTIYFPLVVSGAMMIEPTETEDKKTLDDFIEAMIEIARECKEQPQVVRNAPHNTKVGHLDEVRAAREPVLRYRFEKTC